MSSVSVDDVAGGRLAGAHLKDIGRKRLAYCGNPSVHSHAADRLAGMREGSSMDVELIDTGFVTIAAGVEAGQTIAARSESDRPDAVFCANDLIAIGVLQALIRARIAVPEEIAIVGYDDIEFASQVSVPLTTIRQPAYGLGRRAAEILLAEIAEGPAAPPTHVIHTPELVTRESTLPR